MLEENGMIYTFLGKNKIKHKMTEKLKDLVKLKG